MPMNQLPVLEVDGKRVNQSLACCRFIAKGLQLAGNDDWENLQIDTVADTVNDFRLSMKKFKRNAENNLKPTFRNRCGVI
jgi:prostaglandin-H2 D-isomerase / glutathione transferase